jgi:RNA polymerase sigma factor (sigma-70 family)
LLWSKPKPPPASFAADLRLAERCRRGDRDAKEELFRAYAPGVFPMLRRVTRSQADAEDLLQQVFLAALEGIGRYRGDAPLASWLKTIAVRTAYAYFRENSRRRELFVVAGELGRDLLPHLENRALLRRVMALLERITPKRRIAFLLFEVEGHTLVEISALLDISLTAAKKRVFQAHHELRRLIEAEPQLRESFLAYREEGDDA